MVLRGGYKKECNVAEICFYESWQFQVHHLITLVHSLQWITFSGNINHDIILSIYSDRCCDELPLLIHNTSIDICWPSQTVPKLGMHISYQLDLNCEDGVKFQCQSFSSNRTCIIITIFPPLTLTKPVKYPLSSH